MVSGVSRARFPLFELDFHAQEPAQNDEQGPEQGGGGRGSWGGILAGSVNGDGRISMGMVGYQNVEGPQDLLSLMFGLLGLVRSIIAHIEYEIKVEVGGYRALAKGA